MKSVTAICNAALFAFTCLVLIADGPSTGPGYIVLSLLLLLVPILTVVALFFNGRRDPRPADRLNASSSSEPTAKGRSISSHSALSVAAIALNLILLGFVCWAFISTYPHPDEEGLLTFTVLVFLTPLLSILTIARAGVLRSTGTA